jgi:hypothetical protein
MATIADLNVGIGADPSGLTRGLERAQSQLTGFARSITNLNARPSGIELADTLIAGLTERLRQAHGEISDALERGAIGPAAIAQLAERASAEYTAGLKRGLGSLAAQGLVTDEVRQRFETAFGNVGDSSARAFSETFRAAAERIDTLIRGSSIASTQAESIRGLQQADTVLRASLATTTLTLEQRVAVEEQLLRVQRALTESTELGAAAMQRAANAANAAGANTGLLGRFVNSTTGEFTALGKRGAGALVGIAFALDGIVQSGGKAGDTIHSILRSVATLAPAFGPEGLIVSAVAAGTDAIVSIFTETRRQMDDTVRQFEQSLRQMQNAGDTIGLEKQLQSLQIGEPAAGLSKFSPDSGPLRFFIGSLKDLRAQLADVQGELSAGSFSSAGAVRKLQEEAGRLREAIAPLEAKERSLTQAILDGREALRAPSGLVAITTEARVATGAVDDLVASLQRGMERLRAFEAAGPTVHLTGVVDAVQVPKDAPQIQLPVTFDERQFALMAQRLSDLDAARRAAQSAGLSDETTRRAADEAKEVLLLTAAWRQYVETLIAGNASAEELAEASRRFEKTLKDAGLDSRDMSAGLTKSSDGLDAAAQAARRLQGELGGVGGGLADMLGAIAEVQHALDSLHAPKLDIATAITGVSSIFGALGSVGGLISSIAKPSAAEQAHDRILTENNRQLANLAASLDRFGETASSLQRVEQGVAAVQAANLPFAFPSDLATDRTRDLLAKFGLTLEQVNKVAKDNGITLLDSKGRVVAGTFDQLAKALGITAQQLTTWGKGFADQLNLRKLIDRAAGLEGSPSRDIQNSIAEIIDQAGPSIDAMFKGIDATTEAGRDRLRSVILSLAKSIEAGTITLDQLGGFKNVQEFGGALGDVLDGLDAMADATAKVTDSLLSVPEGFKVALARFNATAIEEARKAIPKIPPVTVPPEPPVVIPTPIPPSIESRPVPTKVTAEIDRQLARMAITDPLSQNIRDLEDAITKVLPPRLADALRGLTDFGNRTATGTDLTGGGFMGELADLIARSKAERAGGDTFQFAPGSIVIEGTTLTPAEMLEALTRAAQLKARSLFGTTARASEVLNV